MAPTLFEGVLNHIAFIAFECEFVEEVTCAMPEGDYLLSGRIYRLPRTPFEPAFYFLLGLKLQTANGRELGRAAPGFDPHDRPAMRGMVIVNDKVVGHAWLARADDGREFITTVNE